METFKLILICVLIVIGVILFFLLIFYLVGNIYNGLVRRRMRVKSSWYEINKLFTKLFEILPEILKNSNHKNNDIKKQIRTIYQDWYNHEDKNDVAFISKKYYELYNLFTKAGNKIPIQNDNDYVLFIKEYITKINFSILFYNENVENYNHFRKLPINIIMAKIFKFAPAVAIEN